MELFFGCVKLRAIDLADDKLLMELMNSPVVEDKTVGWNFPVSLSQQQKWINSYSNNMNCMRWIIELSNGVSIGLITLNQIDWKNRLAFLHYKVNPLEHNRIKGDIKDAIYAVLYYSFFNLGLNRIEGSILKDNIFSIRLIKSMGFVEEGVYRNKVFKNGRWLDEVFYSILSNEFVVFNDGCAPWQEKR
ncbi:MAG: GNAT family N-acetyltransferase [Clostridia bacterium]|nr:GNAT family N-acetyltransferase [Clostridia bacterium]